MADQFSCVAVRHVTLGYVDSIAQGLRLGSGLDLASGTGQGAVRCCRQRVFTSVRLEAGRPDLPGYNRSNRKYSLDKLSQSRSLAYLNGDDILAGRDMTKSQRTDTPRKWHSVDAVEEIQVESIRGKNDRGAFTTRHCLPQSSNIPLASLTILTRTFGLDTHY